MENFPWVILEQICEDIGHSLVVINLFLTCRKLYNSVEIRKLRFEYSMRCDGFQHYEVYEWNTDITYYFFIKHFLHLNPIIFCIVRELE